MALDRKTDPERPERLLDAVHREPAVQEKPRMFVGGQGHALYYVRRTSGAGWHAGLWCCNAGHCRPKITEAIQRQAAELDYARFPDGPPVAFELANRIIDIAPKGIEHVFYTNSGSKASRPR